MSNSNLFVPELLSVINVDHCFPVYLPKVSGQKLLYDAASDLDCC